MSLDWVAWRGLGLAQTWLVGEELARMGSRDITPSGIHRLEFVDGYDVAQAVIGAHARSGGRRWIGAGSTYCRLELVGDGSDRVRSESSNRYRIVQPSCGCLKSWTPTARSRLRF